MELLGATNHICLQEFLAGGREAKVLGLVLHLGGRTPLRCFTIRDSTGIGSNSMSVLLVCGWPRSDLPVEPRGADVMFLCSDGLLVGLSSFSNKQVEWRLLIHHKQLVRTIKHCLSSSFCDKGECGLVSILRWSFEAF